MADPASIQKSIDTYMACFTADDKDGWLDCFAEGAWIEDPVGTPRRTGRDEIGVLWDESHALADSIELRSSGITTIIGSEAAFTMQARPNLAGAAYVMDIIDVMSFDDDAKITTMRAFYDPAAMRTATD
jgi:steroid Delta-isomerase